MTFRALTLRARLTLWHAAVLTGMICVFSAGVFLFVTASLYGALDRELERDLATIDKVYQEETGDLGELAHRMGITLFQVVEGTTVLYETPGWPPDASVPYRQKVRDDATHRIVAARDAMAVRQTLRTLAIILVLGVPCAAGMAIGGGYLLAGRMLKPFAGMAERARRISAESLTERLPVEHPHDEFGRLSAVFNDAFARLHEAFEQLRRFTADASHELRTPLTAIRSVGEVALQHPLSPTAYREVIGSMLEEVDRLTRLVESLLTLTRGESGHIQPRRDAVDLSELVITVAEHLRVLAEEKEQVLTVGPGTGVWVTCDEALVRQGLINLLDNAIKYTPRRGAICVGATRTAAGESAIDVRDTGIGISRTHQGRIFERFYQVDSARSNASRGSGLGLATARWAVEANGGRIEIQSEEGRGSLFRIVLPALEVDRPLPPPGRPS